MDHSYDAHWFTWGQISGELKSRAPLSCIELQGLQI